MTEERVIMKKKLILDVDTGIDDAIAIILAATAPELELLGITTVSGNIDLESATRNTLRVLELIGKKGMYGIHMGAEAPLKRNIRYAVEVHGTSGMAGELEDISVELPENTDAISFMIETIKKYPNEVTVVMTGPETNFALALQQAPEIAKLVKEVVIMGGVVTEKGNESPVAEFNIAIDPEAAHIVFNCEAKVTMVGLDVTKKAMLKKEHFEKLNHDSKVAQFVMNVTHQYMERFFLDNGVRGCAMHDPLAVASVICPELIETFPYFVGVETNSVYCDGQTVCDFDNRWQKEPNVQVALKVDAISFIDLLLSRINQAVS